MTPVGTRIWAKVVQGQQFCLATQTPISLTLDSLRLKRKPFIAQTHDGLRLRLMPRSGESFTFYENLIRKDYLQHGVALKEGDTVVDIGGNIGAFAVLAASIVGVTGRVIVFEPAMDTFARLNENIGLNNLGNITAINCAIGGVPRADRLETGPKSAHASLSKQVDGRQSIGLSQIVTVRTLPDVLDEMDIQRVDLLKIDCEGAEYEIFDALPSEWADRIVQISMEVHRIPDRRPRELAERLIALGFKATETYPLVAFR